MSRWLDEYRAANPPSEASYAVVVRVEQAVREAGRPTVVEMRAALRTAMDNCPACTPELADTIGEGALVAWLLSHGVDPEDCNAP